MYPRFSVSDESGLGKNAGKSGQPTCLKPGIIDCTCQKETLMTQLTETVELETTETGTVRYTRTGPLNGPPVVLLPALGLNRSFWDVQTVALNSRYLVLAVDVLDQTQPRGADFAPTFEGLAAAAAAVITHAQTGPAHVVGLSLGSMIAQTLVLQVPPLVRSLTLIGSAATFAEAGRTAVRERAAQTRAEGMAAIAPLHLARWFTPEFTRQHPDVIERVTQTLLADDPEVHAALWEMVSGLDTLPRLPELTCPTLVIVGAEDTSTPPSAAQRIVDAVAGTRLETVAGSAHLTPLEAPEAVNALLLDFLSAH